MSHPDPDPRPGEPGHSYADPGEGESSAQPWELLKYRDAGIEQVDRWQGKVERLRTALDDLRAGLSHLPPAHFRTSVPDLAADLGTVVGDQRHIDEYVRDVANAFLTAGGYEPVTGRTPAEDPWGWEFVIADDDLIHVGPAYRRDPGQEPWMWTVREGQSLWSIAEARVAEVYGDDPPPDVVREYWQELVAGNDERTAWGGPDLVQPGDVIVLPDVPSRVGPGADAGAAPGRDPSAPPVPTFDGEPMTWDVQSGDTLWSIAEARLGTVYDGDPPAEAVAEYVHRLEVLNVGYHIGSGDASALRPGETLSLPQLPDAPVTT